MNKPKPPPLPLSPYEFSTYHGALRNLVQHLARVPLDRMAQTLDLIEKADDSGIAANVQINRIGVANLARVIAAAQHLMNTVHAVETNEGITVPDTITDEVEARAQDEDDLMLLGAALSAYLGDVTAPLALSGGKREEFVALRLDAALAIDRTTLGAVERAMSPRD